MARLDKLTSGDVPLTIPVGEEAVTFYYKPAKVTPALLNEMDDDKQPTVKLLSEALVGWDVLGENDKPVPTNYETLCGLPLGFLAMVQRAILEDLRPKGKKGAI